MSLRDVAWGPRVETGTNVPSYSGGVAAALWFRIRVFCSRGSLTPVAAPNDSPNDFWRVTGRPDAKKRIRICVLKDVAWGPRVKAGTSVPSYSGGVAAYAAFFFAWSDRNAWAPLIPFEFSRLLLSRVFLTVYFEVADDEPRGAIIGGSSGLPIFLVRQGFRSCPLFRGSER